MKAEYTQDLELQRILLREINKKLKSQKVLQSKSSTTPSFGELQSMCEQITKSQKRASYKTIISVAAILSAGFLVTSFMSLDNSNESSPLSTYYIVENVRGDKLGINTHLALSDDSVSVRILDRVGMDTSTIDAIKMAILSEETVEIDGSITHKTRPDDYSTYYVGWKGALGSITEPTKNILPKSFVFSDSSNAQIIIEIVGHTNPDGYDGITRSILSADKNSITKSHITVYNADKKSSNEIETIIRHEFGHALGLKHSTDPDDLMAPTITSAYPFISECVLEGLFHLYDGMSQEEYECKS